MRWLVVAVLILSGCGEDRRVGVPGPLPVTDGGFADAAYSSPPVDGGFFSDDAGFFTVPGCPTCRRIDLDDGQCTRECDDCSPAYFEACEIAHRAVPCPP